MGVSSDLAADFCGDPIDNLIFGDSTNRESKADSPEGGEPTGIIGPGAFKSFKDDQGRFRTQSLFAEYPHDKYPAFFTLKKQGKKGFINLYEKYMEISDPTEYQVAIQLFGSWDHWNALTRTKWFKDHLTGWRDELKTKMESERYHEMRDKVNDPKAGVQATKWLADRYGGASNRVSKRGRPTKAEKEAHLKRLERDTEDIESDAVRIGLV